MANIANKSPFTRPYWLKDVNTSLYEHICYVNSKSSCLQKSRSTVYSLCSGNPITL